MSGLPIQPYRPRLTYPVECCEVTGWQLKFYAMAGNGKPLSPEVIDASRKFLDVVSDCWPEAKPNSCGFVTLHAGEEANWLLIDLWVTDILHHFLFCSTIEAPLEFKPAPRGLMACVWELEVIKHERDVWVRHVMSKPARPDFELYMQDFVRIDAEE